MSLDPQARLTEPLYTTGEAAKLAGVAPATVKRWLQGYSTPTGPKAPVFGKDVAGPLVSFLQLIEIVVASRFRHGKVTLERVRKAHAVSLNRYGSYPFARLRLQAWAGYILHLMEHDDGSLEAMDSPGTRTLPRLVTEAIAAIDYEDDIAVRWFPLGKQVPVVVDPRFSAGMPTIPQRRVTAAAVVRRFRAGQTIEFIASDLLLTREQVEDVIRHADQIAA